MKNINKTCIKRKKGKLLRAVCIAVLACFLMSGLFGCAYFRSLRLPQLQEFEQQIRKEYPHTSVSCQYEYGAGVMITVKGSDFDDERAYAILGLLQPIVCDEDFILELFTFFEKESNGDPNWKLGRRPDIQLRLDVDGISRYQFWTSATKENYNSGKDPDSYTWDGYTTWFGTEFVAGSPREISSDEVEQFLKRYSQK